MCSQLKLFDDPDTEPYKRKEKKGSKAKANDTTIRKTNIYDARCSECKMPARFRVESHDGQHCTATAVCPVCGKSLGTDHYKLSDQLVKLMEKRRA
jgi:hypothetical protein